MEPIQWDTYRQKSNGYWCDSVIRLHPRIIVGSGVHLTKIAVTKANVKYVVNCGFDEHSPEWFRIENPGNYKCIEAIDSGDVDITEWYPKFEEAMDTFMRDSEGQIYVHCQLGINRSTYLALIYVCLKFNYGMKSTVKHMCINRPCIFSNLYFREQVIKYIEKHNGRVWE